MLGRHTLTPQYLPAAPGSGPEPLACIEWESIEVIVKTTSRSKCYIEFHSYCLEGEVSPWRWGFGVLGVPRGRASPAAAVTPALPQQRSSGAGRTRPRAATSLDSSSWAGLQSICPWYALGWGADTAPPSPGASSSLLVPISRATSSPLKRLPPSSSLSLPLALHPEPQGVSGAVTVTPCATLSCGPP